jgi:Fur family zinc uptake transcriptional regulator
MGQGRRAPAALLSFPNRMASADESLVVDNANVAGGHGRPALSYSTARFRARSRRRRSRLPSPAALLCLMTKTRAPQRGLTPARRAALDILTRANRPVGAYEMIDLLAEASGKRPAPISVYRALGYLLDQGLAHRLASRNAFVVCGHDHAGDEPVIFFICDDCGEVREATSPALAGALSGASRAVGFEPRTRVLEIAGRCARCAESTRLEADRQRAT